MAQVTEQPEIAAGMKRIKMMLLVGGVFVAIGSLLVGSALFIELTRFHPLLDGFFAAQTQHSLAGGGPDRAGLTALNTQLATIHAWPSTLLWLKLGGIAHRLTVENRTPTFKSDQSRGEVWTDSNSSRSSSSG